MALVAISVYFSLRGFARWGEEIGAAEIRGGS